MFEVDHYPYGGVTQYQTASKDTMATRYIWCSSAVPLYCEYLHRIDRYITLAWFWLLFCSQLKTICSLVNPVYTDVMNRLNNIFERPTYFYPRSVLIIA